MNLEKKKVSVVGMGKSGYSIVKILLSMKADVFISDSKDEKALLKNLSGIDINSISYEYGTNTEKIYKNKDLIILSPGVSVNHPIIYDALKAGVSVISEIEFAYRLAQAPIIAVTGTNGKSTTVSLINNLLCFKSIKSVLAGNIGAPLSAEVINHPEASWIVAEISSFQLETILDFRPKIGILTNITPDHTDRHGNMDNYIKAKARLFENQTNDDYAIVNYDCPNCLKAVSNIKSKTIFFSSLSKVKTGFFVKDGHILSSFEGKIEEYFDIDAIPLKGVHNLKNILALCCTAHILGISITNCLKSLGNFVPLHHRMEFVKKIGSVSFYNDSKGSNPGAVIAAINSINEPFVLIAGGKDKNMDFSSMSEIIAQKAKALVVIGETGEKIAAQVKSFGFKNIFYCDGNFEKAIKTAFNICGEGIVLLSPACASFDMFDSAEHRGDEFKRIVSEMEK